MEWIEVEGFPAYEVSRAGEIRHAHTKNLRHSSRTQSGASKITLFLNGEPFTRSLALVVAKAHLYNDYDPEIFDTPIHLDNDLMNNHVDNLAWRPRWFAVKYQKQYWHPEYRHVKTAVIDLQTGDEYETLIEPCQRYGLLYTDILTSCTRGGTVFPTWKEFRFND